MMKFEEVIESLRDATRANRVTLRLELPDAAFPVVVESLADGAASLIGDLRVDPTATATFQHVERERQILVQRDCLHDKPRPGTDLIELYGVRAQMLAPVERDGRLVGVISVHETDGSRDWSDEDVASLRSVADKIAELLAAAGPSLDA